MSLCECGCGQEIIAKPHHKWYGTPRFLNGHWIRANNPMKNLEIAQKNKEIQNRPDVKRKNSESHLEVMNRPEVVEKAQEMSLSQWQDPGYTRLVFDGRNVTPNQAELKLQELLTSLNLPYKFVGDGKLIMGGKCPDFVNINGQKKLIELFGDYWHSEEITGHSIEKEEQERIGHFFQLGFNTLIIWESELSCIESLSQRILLFEQSV